MAFFRLSLSSLSLSRQCCRLARHENFFQNLTLSSRVTFSSAFSSTSSSSSSSASLALSSSPRINIHSMTKIQKQQQSSLHHHIRSFSSSSFSSSPRKKATSSTTQEKDKMRPDLNAIVRLELLEKETPERIEEIWLAHFKNSNCLSAVIPSDKYQSLKERMERYPVLILPWGEREGHYVPIMLAVQGDVHSYSLVSDIKRSPEGYSPQVVVKFYTDLQKKKGIVLLKGDVMMGGGDGKLKVEDGQFLVGLSQLFYLDDNFFRRFVVPCNRNPEKFKFEEMVNVLFGKEEGEMRASLEEDDDDDDIDLVVSASDLKSNKKK